LPLLGRTEKLAFANVTPIPPYPRAAHPPVTEARRAPGPPGPQCAVCFRPDVSARPLREGGARQTGPPATVEGPDLATPFNNRAGVPGLAGFSARGGPVPPDDPDRNKKKRISVGSAVQQAMLTHRVEPVYPAPARQLRRSGQVHLRAIISVNGSIESLELMDGDPLFIRSALDAVKQWHYQPTELHGQPVEVETIITVVYRINE